MPRATNTAAKARRAVVFPSGAVVALALWTIAKHWDEVEGVISGTPREQGFATTGASLFNEITLIALPIIVLPFVSSRTIRAFLNSNALRKRAVPLCLYLGWAALSMLWSSEPTLSFRRVSAAIIVVAGAGLLGVGLYGPRETMRRSYLTLHGCFFGAAMGCALLLIARSHITLGFLLDPNQFVAFYRFPTYIYAFSLAIALVAALVQWRKGLSSTWIAIVAPLTAVGWALLKVRSIFAFGFACAVIGYVAIPQVTRFGMRMATSRFRRILAVGALAALMGGFAGGQVLNWLKRGQADGDFNSLTGRTQLWNVLIEYYDKAPVTGFGYGAFWTNERMLEVASRVGWVAPTAHNGFLENLINLGAVGALLYAATWLIILVDSYRLARRTGLPIAWVSFLWSVLHIGLDSTGTVLFSAGDMGTYFALTAYFATTAAVPNYIANVQRARLSAATCNTASPK